MYIALLKRVQTAKNAKDNTQTNPIAIKINNIIPLSNEFIRFISTSVHCNIESNEEADNAAKNAIDNSYTKILSLMLPVDIIRNVDKYSLQLWDSEWHLLTENKLKEIKHTQLIPGLNSTI